MLAPFGTPQAGAGALDGPLAVDNYKRAVYRPPPARFMVDMLPPTKQGSQYSFGMRITPILRGDRSSVSSSESKLSTKSNVGYEAWRRWEDCLWFQDTLELEYSRLARMKRQRLLAGKGVKKDGFYLQDRASSWESLPPGPEPNSVARDIHDIIPKLTKKGTLFRASQATIEQRHSELTAFVEALFAEDVPTLLAELRADRMVTDFFGYWRRDYDLAMKNDQRSGNKQSKPRSSITSIDGLRTPTAAQWSGTRGIRDSWQTTGSATTYLEGLNIAIPNSPAHIYHSSRLSIGSIATFMTDSSADAIIPRNRTPSISTRRSSFMRKSRPLSIYTVTDDGPWSDGDEDLLDSCIFDAFPMPAHLFPFQENNKTESHESRSASSGSRPETPLGHLPIIPTSPLHVEISDERLQSIPEDVQSVTSRLSSLSETCFTPVPPSPTTSTTSTEFSSFTAASGISVSTTLSTSTAVTSVLSGNLTIKAAHNQSIILLRTSRETEFAEVRQRIYDKFLAQEKITLTEAFAIAFVLQDPGEPRSSKGKGRARSNSLGGGSSQMILVTNQNDWDRALATTESSKITVRVLDTFQE
ncbi:hypothetical protein LENED_001706 [Lentinula edodes]|uniref:PX domain-containing protein n=1 Tax=Lentinula edodes TaxID=5353 RepID=A0A1Q3DYY0_LENED|nr:hypothetical protein LENED_001706 [Lentinula edodes]